jgi:FKBP-type peptidyl-prolyl cis-trans isomerase (trigger factor)
MVKVLKLYDYTECDLPEKLFEIKIPQKKIDGKIEKAAEHFLAIADQEGAIEKGDIVAIKIASEDAFVASECERFSIGKGFFSKDIEDALIGKQKGDVFTITPDGVPAEITVLWAKRRVVPAFTDAMAAAMDVEDVATVQEYTDYVTQELVFEDKEKKQNAIWTMVSRKILEESEFEVDEAEIEAQYKKDITYLQKELEDDFEEFMQVKYHGKTIDECKQNFKKEIVKTLELCAIAEPMAKEDSVEWTREEYDAVIEDMVSEEYSREELEQSMSYEDYVKQQKEAYLQGKVLEYFDCRFTVTII